MPDSFFQSDKKRKRTRPNDSAPSRDDRGGGRGRGRGRGGGSGPSRGGAGGGSSSKSQSSFYRPSMYGKGSRSNKDKDENLSSESEAEGPNRGGDIDDMDLQAGRGEEDYMSDDGALDEHETAAEKRVRLAKGYLEKVRKEVEDANQDMDYDAAEIDREIIASRLQKDVAESEGRIHTFLASKLTSPAFRSRLLSIPSHAPTSVALTPADIYISTKRGTVFRYDLDSLRRSGSPFGQNMPAKSVSAKSKGKGKAKVNGKPNGHGKGLDEKPEGHKGEILSIAASEDGQYVVTGGRDKLVGVWGADGADGTVQWVAGIRGHKDAVTGVAIPPLNNPSHHILTCSLSRHLALQSLSTLSTIETFFGHQDSIASVAAIKPTAAVTAGSRDRTCRWWKVEEEVQLVLRGGGRSFWMGEQQAQAQADAQAQDGAEKKEDANGGEVVVVPENQNQEPARVIPGSEPERPKRRIRRGGKEYVEGSIDVVCVLDDQRFVSGGDSGTISLWNTGKKKPIFSVSFAHGVETVSPSDLEARQVDSKTVATNRSAPTDNGEVPRWITSLAALRGTDLFASGSWDGQIRIWALDPSFRSFKLLTTLPCAGFINGLQMLSVQAAKVDLAAFGAYDSANGAEGTEGTNGNEGANGHAAIESANAVLDAEDDDDDDAAEEDRPKKRSNGQTVVLAAAVSQEPRLGRWMRIKDGVRNGLFVAALPL